MADPNVGGPGGAGGPGSVGGPGGPSAPAAPAPKPKPLNFSFHGQDGGAFTIYGNGLGDGGTVMIDGKPATVTAWNDQRIKGQVPDGASVDAKIEVIGKDGVAHAEPRTEQEKRRLVAVAAGRREDDAVEKPEPKNGPEQRKR